MNHTEKVAKWLEEKHSFEPEDATKVAKDLLSLIDQQGEPVAGPWKLWSGWGPADDGLMRVERIGPSMGGLEAFYNAHKTDIQATLEDLELVVNAVNAYLHPPASREREYVIRIREIAMNYGDGGERSPMFKRIYDLTTAILSEGSGG